MPFARRLLPFAALLMLPLASGAKAATPTPEGLWMWDTGEAAVEFHPCTETLCARVIWVKEEAGPEGAVLLDARNPDPALRERRVCGLDYITGLKRTKKGDWRRGRIYDFHSGKSYDLDLDAVDAEGVTMRGYKGVRALGATLKLVRSEDPSLACKSAD